jgi:hypothetical protein
MKTKRNDTGANSQRYRCPMAALEAESTHKRKKAVTAKLG